MSVPTGPGGVPDPTFLDCESVACRAALSAIVDARNEIILKCSDIAAAEARASSYLAVVGSLFGLAGAIIGALLAGIGLAATIALLTVVSLTLNWVAFWVAISLVATALLFLTFWGFAKIQVAILQGNLSGFQHAFLSQVQNVEKSCPTTCWGDLKVPTC